MGQALDLDSNLSELTREKLPFKYGLQDLQYSDLVNCHTWNLNYCYYQYCFIIYCLGSKIFFS